MERSFVKWLQHAIGSDRRLPLGLDDDAAWVRDVDRDRCIVTTDLLAEGVHFRLDQPGAVARAGRKALAVNLSDLAAMAARPVAAFASILLPAATASQVGEQLYEGMLPLAEQFGVAIGGGDTNTWDGPLVICVTALGEAPAAGPLTRSGARPGDALVVTGTLGGSLAGKHLDFVPRVAPALYLHSHYPLHAGIDISDGLLLDLDRLCQASGCGAVLDLSTVPISRDARRLASGELDPQAAALQHALSDGEDFELILALPMEVVERLIQDSQHGLTCSQIGRCIEEAGLWHEDESGKRSPLQPLGYEHGR